MKSKLLWVEIKNFRSHKDTYVEFGDFTVILGETDSGKSAMLGSIRWCLFNDPSGDNFIRREYEVDENGIAILGEDGSPVQKSELTCDVECMFDNGKSVRHVKGPSDHFYELKENGQVILPLRNFGVGPVKEVMDFHGMHRVDFFGEKQVLNFCPQMDKPFFLGESGPTRATMIGKLAHTDTIDLAIKNTDSELRDAKKKVRGKKVELKQVTDELKLYKHLPKLEKDIEKIDKYITQAEDAQNRYNLINTHLLKLRELNVQKSKLELVIAHETEINRTVELLEASAAVMVRINSIIKINNMRLSSIEQKLKVQDIAKLDENKMIEAIDKCDSSISLIKQANDIQKINDRLIKEKINLQSISKVANANIDIDTIINLLDSCRENIAKYYVLTSANAKLLAEVDRKTKGSAIIKNLESSFNSKFAEYKDMLKKFNICPICFGEITDERVDSLQDII